MEIIYNKSVQTRHFAFFEKDNKSWEAYTVIAESEPRAWELLEMELGKDSENYAIEDLGVKRSPMGHCYEPTVIEN